MSGKIQVYYGEGRGKTTAALGTAIREASLGKSVIFIQFLKGKNWTNIQFMERLEPEIRFFRFEKADEFYEHLSDEEKREESQNIINGFHYAKKVLTTGECDVVVLDEVLGLVGINFGGSKGMHYSEALNIIIERLENQPYLEELKKEHLNNCENG